ncbi:hypothetical protein [Nocardioides sp. T2.26MG-1]|uniref:hypothetical protein n=1 Tax=Nocardioides sp. T2.26MG-1 TaxID=3041166 RepID=UPI002477AF24|nr:hypothetical protein [Nocardioides sp. T2.26MG-1]CAI9418497.1 hypothetical protein HIDPHFAB_03298 [Nocardioides sp. T2.26MG-1]
MNATRRTRLFLDHKPPLVAFAVVSIACALMMVHVARSEAAPGWLRAGLSGIVAQHVIEATVLEPDPAPARTTEAAGPLPTADGPVGSPSGDGDGSGTDAGSPPADSAVTGGTSHLAGAQVGVVDAGDATDPFTGIDDDPAGSADADGDQGPGKGHQGKGQGQSKGDDEQVDAGIPAPGTSAGPDPRDWRDDWVGDHGKGGHGKGDHAKGDHAKGDHAKGDHAKGDHAKGDHAKGDHAKGDHGNGGHGHANQGDHGNGGHGHADHGEHGHGQGHRAR